MLYENVVPFFFFLFSFAFFKTMTLNAWKAYLLGAALGAFATA